MGGILIGFFLLSFIYIYYLEKVGEHGRIIPVAQRCEMAIAPLPNANAAAKCINEGAQKRKKLDPI